MQNQEKEKPMENSRPIRFRAWDGKLMSVFSLGIDRVGMLNLPPYPAKGRPFKVLMQYTGLKDKSGKDVFEGDNLYVVDDVVVETIGGYPRTEPEGRTETVKYERGAFWWGEELLWEVAEHGEVISNIYEDEGSTK